MLCVMAGKVLHSSLTTPFLGNITHHMASEDHGWNLILVNRENYIPADYEVQLTELSNGKKVDSRIYPELQEMFNAAGRRDMVCLLERDIGHRKNSSN